MERDPSGPAAGGPAEGLAPRVLREVLRTPAFREVIRLHAGAPAAADARAAIETVLREDVEPPLALASTCPAAVNAAVESAATLGEHLARMPRPLLDAYLDEVLGEIDVDRLRALPASWGPVVARALAPRIVRVLAGATEALASSLAELDERERAEVVRALVAGVDGHEVGAAANALSSLVIRLHGASPEPLADRRLARDLVRATDLGKARVAAAALSGSARDAAKALVAEAAADPVALANLIMTLPPLLNDQLEVLATLVTELDLPDEMFASALLNVLAEIRADEVGRIVTGLARALDTIHDGSRILGHTEPAFGAVARELVDGLRATLDAGALARAAVVLGEDGETLLGVLADLIGREPGVVAGFASALLGGAAPLLRGTTAVLRSVNALPDEVFDEVAREAAQQLDPDLLRRLLGESLACAGRLRLGRPEPERVGEAITGLLARFSAYMERERDPGSNYLLRVVAAIDPLEAERAWHAALGAWSGTLLGSAERARAIVRPLLVVGWGALRLAARRRRSP